MLHLYGNKNQFNSHVGNVGQILTDKSIKFIFTDRIPSSNAAACFVPKENTVYLPAIDPNKLTEYEAQKVMGLSAHERKHVKLTDPKELENLSTIIKESQEKGIPRGILHNLWQTIEDLRIEMNKNYSFHGDMINIHHVNDIFFEEIKNNPILPTKNPFGFLMECIRYRTLSFHPEFIRTEFLQIPPELEDYYNKAMNIMNDGRFTKSLEKGKESNHITLELAIEIEKAWAQEYNEENKEKNGGQGQGNGDLKPINEKFDVDQAQNYMSCNPLIDAVNAICEALIEKEKEQKNQNRYITKNDTYISYGMVDTIINDPPNQREFEKVFNTVGPTITHVRDKIAIHLKSISDNRTLRGLRRGQLDHQRLYQTVLGYKNVMKKVFPCIDYSTAVQIVVDLSGSMSYGNPLARYQMAMQMSIILAEVFQLLRVPFEITGFNTSDFYHSNPTPDYEGERRIHFRTEKVNFHIFKAFSDDYSIAEVKHRLGSITAAGCNIDHEVIRWSAARLWKQKERRKLQIILSDGQPSGNGGTYSGLLASELKNLNERIIKSGINQFAFGLQSESVKEYYKKYVILEKLEELNSKALEIFVDFLMENIHTQNRGY